MYEFQNLTKQPFLEPIFEELACFRKFSDHSIKDWNLIDDQRRNDLQLIIEDVGSLEMDLLDNDKTSFMNFTFNPIDDQFILDYDVQQQNLTTQSQTSKPVLSKTPTHINFSKTKKIFKGKTKSSKSSKHKLTLSKLCYQKNICRNIIRKAIRAIECQTYQSQILYLCNYNIDFYNEFKEIVVGSVELITGPRALNAFLEQKDDVSKIFQKFLIWYLKEKYLREALQSGQMDNVEKYIEYKNWILLPLLKSI